jgi:hypothetical protein
MAAKEDALYTMMANLDKGMEDLTDDSSNSTETVLMEINTYLAMPQICILPGMTDIPAWWAVSFFLKALIAL